MNNPTRVSFLDQAGNEIFSVTESHPESLNNRGSERTRSIRIEGPANSVVTCFDDQQFRMGQNSVQITKIVAEPIVVPIAADFVAGQQHSGVFFGSTATYKWQFNKAIEQKWWSPLVTGGWEVAKQYLKSKEAVRYVPIGDGVEAYVSSVGGGASDNNRIDNISSIKFGA